MCLLSSVIALFFIGMMVALVAMTSDAQISYPETRRVDHVDTYHGVQVEDPYRWLEDDVRSSKDVAEWVEAQNKDSYFMTAKEWEEFIEFSGQDERKEFFILLEQNYPRLFNCLKDDSMRMGFLKLVEATYDGSQPSERE